MSGKRVTTREGRMARRTERWRESRTDGRRPDPTKELLIVKVEEVPDSQTAIDQFDRVRPPIAVNTQKTDDVCGKAVRLCLDLRHKAIPVSFHQFEQMRDFNLDFSLSGCVGCDASIPVFPLQMDIRI